MVIFHSYVSLPEAKPPFSYGFPMVFLWFSYGFPITPFSASARQRPSQRLMQSQQVQQNLNLKILQNFHVQSKTAGVYTGTWKMIGNFSTFLIHSSKLTSGWWFGT